MQVALVEAAKRRPARPREACDRSSRRGGARVGGELRNGAALPTDTTARAAQARGRVGGASYAVQKLCRTSPLQKKNIPPPHTTKK